jgi:predicted ATPase/DNA-binding SARP family transcriptional activator/DNA-binding CsgD family transcriptional regulator
VSCEQLRVRLLGGFQVSVGLRTIAESEWRLRKAARLVKLLALAPNHRMHRDEAMHLLWPKLDTKAAANNLRYSLHNARRTLEPISATAFRYLHLQGELLTLYPAGTLWVDTEAFKEGAIKARRTRELVAYEAAIALYIGDLLPEDRYEVWAEGRREELRRTYLDLLLELAELYKDSEEFELAIQTLRRVVASEPAHEVAHAELMRLYALSGQRQVALGQYEQLRRTLLQEFGTEPGTVSYRIYNEVLADRFPLPSLPPVDLLPEQSADTILHNLPAARTGFVGRMDELAGIKRALATIRLLTLTGACGSGKTRLALKAVGDLVGEYPDGVWLVELAELSEEAMLSQAVAEALGVSERPGQPLTDTLMNALREKKMLLVLDNCEHLIDAVARLVDTLLDSCPHLRVLATSREALGVAGEVKWMVPPLSLPNLPYSLTLEDVAKFESVQLFLERARCHRPAFVLTTQNVEAVIDICRQLEGLPLALELAAARISALSVKQIAAKLKTPFRLLTTGSRTAPPRQRTLYGALDWSYTLLTEPERKFFAWLSVFADGWTLEAAETVGAGDGIQKENVLELLSRLVDKSLVTAKANGDGTSRYRMLGPFGHYGREKLEESGEEAERVRQRHAALVLALAEEAEPELKGVRQEKWLERLETERGNLNAALSWALESGEAELGLQLSGALGEFWHLRGHLGEGRRWLEAALANRVVPPAPARPKALARAGCIAWEQGDYERSVALSQESLLVWRELGDTVGEAAALSNLGWAALFQNQLERASTLAEEAGTLQRASGDKGGLARTLPILGLAAAAQHNYERAAALHEESLALARKVKDNFAIILSLALGALVSLGLGDHGRVRDLCAEGLELSRQLKMKHLTATHLHVSAALAASQGQPVHSARLWGAAEALREAIGTIFSPLERHFYEPYIAAACAQLEEAAWDEAWAEGRTMGLEVGTEYAPSEERRAPTMTPMPEEPPASRQQALLTRREREVAALVGRGLSNRQISAELVISEHTVATHVCKIFKKLGLHSRAQVAAWVAEQPLPPSNSN